jgi:hypothetical protein
MNVGFALTGSAVLGSTSVCMTRSAGMFCYSTRKADDVEFAKDEM